MCRFSLLTVCLNPGDKLRSTLESALMQSFEDFEIIIKDGGSKDGSIEGISDLLQDRRLKLFQEKDTGIYDAMNQAVMHATGDFVFFLNCGDKLYDKDVLQRVHQEAQMLAGSDRCVIYGNIFNEKKNAWIAPSPRITGFTCFRNIPCHQACFYSTVLCKEKPFETKYKIRGDYEHFLWCFYQGNAKMHYLDGAVSCYEGGGFSETKENLKRSKKEHKEITEKYMAAGELFQYRFIMAITLAPLRTALSESKTFAGPYNALIGLLYKKRG